ncbi:hypothetical protein Plim_3608 [Planctopirus limnophila DSM 3776]|uniref:Thioredoxin domain-containing protein n=1 Tax=Planctopirus limnophila (strain ATCC 43296 / DSM 3776 / IFAM 1008 / Mu 290) TaxID=521674 RepID=D5SVR1_PLAL2|nr:thioredoxin family protein [Planctopirus limnophila]ADG69421.1 hypothetical protein Plim_3608 [Planctopirus limnophila DSM 3776]
MFRSITFSLIYPAGLIMWLATGPQAGAQPHVMAEEALSQSTKAAWPSLFAEAASPASPVNTAQNSRALQWLVFYGPGCVPCMRAIHDFQPWLKASGWEVSEVPQAHIRLIDANREQSLARQFQIEAWPTFVLMHEGKVLERHTSYPGRQFLADRYLAAAARVRDQRSFTSHEPVSAISMGTLSNTSREVALLLESTRPLLEAGLMFEGRLLPASQKASGSLPASTTISLTESAAIRLYWPLVFRLSRQQNSLHLDFEKPYPQFRMSNIFPVEQSIEGLTATTQSLTIELPRMIDLKWQLD